MKLPLGNSGATYLWNVTNTVQTVQYSNSQCTQQQYWHECRRFSWLHEGVYCIAPQPFTRFVFYFLFKPSWDLLLSSLAWCSTHQLYTWDSPFLLQEAVYITLSLEGSVNRYQYCVCFVIGMSLEPCSVSVTVRIFRLVSVSVRLFFISIGNIGMNIRTRIDIS